MKKKRFLIIVMIIAMFTAIIAPTASAKSIDINDIQNMPNAICFAMFNPYCRYMNELKDVSVKITKAGTDVNIVIPIKPMKIDDTMIGEFFGDEEAPDSAELTFWVSDETAQLSEAVMEQLKEIQGKVDLGTYGSEKTIRAIEKALGNFKLELIGDGTEHYTVEDDGGAIILTNDIFQQIVSIIKEAYGYETDKEFESFASLIKEIMADSEIDINKLSAEEKAAIEDLINNIDPIVEYLQSNDFRGVFVGGVYADCDCFDIEYTVQNRYYKNVNGKLELVGTEYVMNGNEKLFVAYNGDMLDFNQYINTSYKGQTYKYVGCYDSWCVGSDYNEYIGKFTKFSDIDDYKLEQTKFELAEDTEYGFSEGVILCYVVDGQTQATPNTGDGIYTAVSILGTALMAGGVSIVLKKKKSA